MVDYKKATGAGGEMMIRDLGSTVEYWIKAGSDNTWFSSEGYSWTYNGSTGSGTYSYPQGGAWKKLRSFTVTTDQTVVFKIEDSGTSGIGGPTTFSQFINRTSAPGKPGAWVVEQIWDTSIQGDTDSMPNGGIAIDQVQVRYSLSSSASSPLYYDPGTDGYGTITGLARKTKYYFWVRTHNSKGWSVWSSATSATTHDFPPAPTAVVPSELTQSTVKASFSSNGDGGSPVLEWQVGHSTDPAGPTAFQSGESGMTVTGLTAGAITYLWARGRNTYGWGDWSAVATAALVAGAWITYDGVQKRAVPYVKVDGVWRVAEVRVNIKGLWKGTG